MEKQCGNCRHFSEYYVKSEHQFMASCQGQCKLKRVDRNQRSSFCAACDKWERIEKQIQRRKKTVSEAIIDISEKINRLAAILTDEE